MKTPEQLKGSICAKFFGTKKSRVELTDGKIYG